MKIVNTSNWDIKPKSMWYFRLGTSVYLCERTFWKWAIISYCWEIGQ
jgi:hypothetical protein